MNVISGKKAPQKFVIHNHREKDKGKTFFMTTKKNVLLNNKYNIEDWLLDVKVLLIDINNPKFIKE